MSRPTYPGTCLLCNQTFAKSGMSRHLTKHDQLPGGIRLLVSGRYLPDYWLQLAIDPTATLEDLDLFLRNIWLECCGHLSSFSINNRRYDSYFEQEALEYADGDMNIKLAKVIQPGLKFSYEYDFGSTTDLSLKVINQYQSWSSEEDIVVLARNHPPESPCAVCGQLSSHLCEGCAWEGIENNAYCQTCLDKHDCQSGEEICLPIVNSPRVGVCAYSAED